MVKKPRLGVHLTLDVVALLIFAMFTFSMASTVMEMDTWPFRLLAALLALGSLSFAIRAAADIWHTLVALPARRSADR